MKASGEIRKIANKCQACLKICIFIVVNFSSLKHFNVLLCKKFDCVFSFFIQLFTVIVYSITSCKLKLRSQNNSNCSYNFNPLNG